MHELRPDIHGEELDINDLRQIDERVVAPTEPLDDRDSEEPDFQVEEELSCTNTDFGGFNEEL